MVTKTIARPFQEGYLSGPDIDAHVFTDYRWNDGSVSRRWHVDPEGVDDCRVFVRPFSLGVPSDPDQ